MQSSDLNADFFYDPINNLGFCKSHFTTAFKLNPY